MSARAPKSKNQAKATGYVAVRAGSGNVFADLGLPDAADRLAKAELA
jgi:hypothetical protein